MITLTKHHGLGNDFLVTCDEIRDPAAAAVQWCDRRRGIGADGLLLLGFADVSGSDVGGACGSDVGRTSGSDVAVSGDGGRRNGPSCEGAHPDRHRTDVERLTMMLYNADGSRAEISGNGIRCLAQAAARQRGVEHAEYRVATDAGERRVIVKPGARANEVWVEVEMGAVARLQPPVGWGGLGVDPMRPVAHLSLGNPHSVVAVDDVASVDLLQLGQLVPNVNLEIVAAGADQASIMMRVHERGAGITEACGTGACASAWAASQWGLTARDVGEITVHMPGGHAKVRLDSPAPGEVTLIGPATYIATITLSW